MLQMKKMFLVYKIEYQWKKIRRNRNKMEVLIKRREPYSSPRLVRLNTKNWELWWSARQMERLWSQLTAE